MIKNIYYLILLLCLNINVAVANESISVNSQASNPSSYGAFGGFGFVMDLKEGQELPIIVEILDNTPAHRSGLQAGDILTHVDGESLKGHSLSRVTRKTRGKPGSTAELTVLRSGSVEPIKFEITREILKPSSQSKGQNDGYIWVVLLLIAAIVIYSLRTKSGDKGNEGAEEKK
jgi:C-terminal processing protease CtpA/Prc